MVPALLGVRSIFDGALATDDTFAGLLTNWYGTIETHGSDGLEILAGAGTILTPARPTLQCPQERSSSSAPA